MSREKRVARVRMRGASLLVLLATAAALSSCSDRVAAPIDGGGGATTVNMTSNLRFEPATVTIKVGETVTWQNTSGGVPHTVTADADKAASASDVQLPAGAQAFDSGSLSGGAKYTHTFTVAGTYKYFCQFHEGAGMVGTVVVTQ